MLSGNLEYLMSSLPHLQFTNAVEYTNRVHKIFKAYILSEEASSPIDILNLEASKYLSSEKEQLFHNIELDTIHNAEFQKSKYTVLSGFSKFNLNLKTQLKSFRDSRKESPETTNKTLNPITLEEANPLEQEIKIVKLQWQEVELLAIGHFSDFDALISYKIKLLLMQRWWSFNEKVGYETYLDLIKTRDDG
jgi:hypothetical protein